MKKPLESIRDDVEARLALRKLTRRSLLTGGLGAAAFLAGWRWLQTRPEEGGTPWPFRSVLRANEGLARRVFDAERLAPTFNVAVPVQPRANGTLGLKSPLDLSRWRLRIESRGAPETRRNLRLEDIYRLPRTSFASFLYCIEGWNDLGSWGGVRFSDFFAAYPPKTRSGKPADWHRRPDDVPQYVALATPDGGYFVGLDMASAMHPQTLLVYEMGGRPLTASHGAPLRLYTPVKYGIKSLKRIGSIQYTDERPRDYWAERGYDWYAGL